MGVRRAQKGWKWLQLHQHWSHHQSQRSQMTEQVSTNLISVWLFFLHSNRGNSQKLELTIIRAKTCKGTGQTAALGTSCGGRSHTGNYKGPTLAGSGLQERGAEQSFLSLWAPPLQCTKLKGSEWGSVTVRIPEKFHLCEKKNSTCCFLKYFHALFHSCTAVL